MTQEVVNMLAKDNGINPKHFTNVQILFEHLIEQGIIPKEFESSHYTNVEIGHFGFYSLKNNSVTVSQAESETVEDRDYDFNSFAIKDFLNDLYKAFKSTDFEILEFHSVTGHGATAIVASKSMPSNKLTLKASMEGWVIV